MKHHNHIEVLTPRQDAEDLDRALETFADKVRKVVDAGYILSVPDNPMGVLHFQYFEVAEELGLKVPPDRITVHVNTFHTREGLDDILAAAESAGIENLLVISGDGSERLPKLTPESLGMPGTAVTSVELLRHIHKAYPGRFRLSAAFNTYEPQDHELEKARRKLDAGAACLITQPILGVDDRLEPLRAFPVPVVIGAWMSKRIHLLSECVGYEIPEGTAYDPIENLKSLRRNYPDSDCYLSLLGFKTQLPVLDGILDGG